MSIVTITKSGFPNIVIDFETLRDEIKSFDYCKDYVKFEKGLSKFTEEEFEENKKILLNFLDELEKDSTKRENLYNSLELTKAGKIKQNVYSHFINVKGFIPFATCDEYANYSYSFLGIREDWTHNLVLDMEYKNCAATKLPWEKIATTKKIKAKDTIPMHYYKDSYGKEFLYLGAFEVWERNPLVPTQPYTKVSYFEDAAYIYISKAKLKKYDKASDLSLVVKDMYTKCNILAKPKVFIEDIGIETRPLADEIEGISNSGWEIKLVKI